VSERNAGRFDSQRLKKAAEAFLRPAALVDSF
jgi:hypothetical protein